ncbi:MAG TPA: twin-arginine translocation signal domain-containing protein, partial [Bacteroidetes bacterium]|nr:twin-arginine translocation signal domain-containing protein [Bacteroidota bacterium]
MSAEGQTRRDFLRNAGLASVSLAGMLGLAA